MDYIKEDKIIEDVKKLLAIPMVNGVVFHWLEEMKYKFHHEIKQYKELENIIDQKENQTDEKNTSLKTVEFELVKESNSWKVIPGNKIPAYIIDHIINLDIDTDQSHMERINIEKDKSIDLVVTKHCNNYYTGSIKETIIPVIEKQPGKHQHQHLNKMPPLEWEKKEELKAILNYLLKYEIFYDFVRVLFRGKWKSYLDNEILQINNNDKEGIISG
jgi:hypothetical protein